MLILTIGPDGKRRAGRFASVCHLHAIDSRVPRSLPARSKHGFDRILRAGENGLDIAVPEVSDPAGQPKLIGSTFDKDAKADALNASGYTHMHGSSRLHPYSSVRRIP